MAERLRRTRQDSIRSDAVDGSGRGRRRIPPQRVRQDDAVVSVLGRGGERVDGQAVLLSYRAGVGFLYALDVLDRGADVDAVVQRRGDVLRGARWP